MKEQKIYLVPQGLDKTRQAGLIPENLKLTGLSTLGIRQSQLFAEKLADKDIQAIYTSTSPAAKETGKIIAGRLKIPRAIARNGFSERNMGSLGGKHLVDLPQLSSEIMQGKGEIFCIQAEGVESFPKILSRTRIALREIQKKHLGENLLIIPSSQVGRMVFAAFCGIDWKEGLLTPYYSNSDIIELSPKINLSK